MARWPLSLALMLILGCGHATSPVAAPNLPAEVAPVAAPPAGAAQLGVWDFAFDPVTGSLEMTPWRSPQLAIGDNLASDLTEAFTSGLLGCGDCFRASNITVIRGTLQDRVYLEFSVRHPFPAPTSPGMRADLHITNVRVALEIAGTRSFFGDLPGQPAVSTRPALWDEHDLYEAPGMVPVDGAIDLMGTSLFTTTDVSNPTGNFSPTTGWQGQLDGPTGYNVLRQGASAVTSIGLRLAAGDTVPLTGRIHLFANYPVSSLSKATRTTPVYYMPEGAMLEASFVELQGSRAIAGVDAVQVPLKVKVIDWQAGAIVDPAFPNPANPTGIKAPSGVKEVWIDIPDFQDAAPFGPATTPSSGTGMPTDPWIYDIVVTKPAGLPGGDYPAMAMVIDERSSADGLDASLDVLTGLKTLTPVAAYDSKFLTVCTAIATGGWTTPHVIDETTGTNGAGCALGILNNHPIATFYDKAAGQFMYAQATVALPTATTDWDLIGIAAADLLPQHMTSSLAVVGNRAWIAFVGGTLAAPTLEFARAKLREPITNGDFDIYTLDSNVEVIVEPQFVDVGVGAALFYTDYQPGAINVALPSTIPPLQVSDWNIHAITDMPTFDPEQFSATYAGGHASVAFIDTSGDVGIPWLAQANVTLPTATTDWTSEQLLDPGIHVDNIELLPYASNLTCLYTSQGDISITLCPSYYPSPAVSWLAPIALTTHGLGVEYGQFMDALSGSGRLLVVYTRGNGTNPAVGGLEYLLLADPPPFGDCSIDAGLVDGREGRRYGVAIGTQGTGIGILEPWGTATDAYQLEGLFQEF
ncbi:MAG: hypothetical protein ABI743_05590 [bacterium]